MPVLGKTLTIAFGEGGNRREFTLHFDAAGLVVAIDLWKGPYTPEDVERLAHHVFLARHREGDMRLLCVEHGFHEDRCAECERPE